MKSMTVATWNIHALRGASSGKLRRVAAALRAYSPDIVTLQEVSSRGDIARQLADRLAEVGLEFSCWSETSGLLEKRYGDKAYGNLIVSRWPLRQQVWPVEMEWPQLVVAAEVAHPVSDVLVVDVHIPNGSGNGWEKVFAFEALAEGLADSDLPTVLAGDFNEPRSFDPVFLSFGANRTGGLDGRFTDLHGVTHPRRRWQKAVEAAISPSPSVTSWDGLHVTIQKGVAFEPTHVVSGRFDRYFDHILTSRTILKARSVTYDHEVRQSENPISDHSLVTAILEFLSPSRRH